MPYLTEADLKATYYPRASSMAAADVKLYLQRANSFAWGEIGGMPPTVDDPLKAAVATAFEILAKGETGANVNAVNGNITEAAPAGFFARNGRQYDPLDAVRTMLRPYRTAFENANAAKSDKGVRFL